MIARASTHNGRSHEDGIGRLSSPAGTHRIDHDHVRHSCRIVGEEVGPHLKPPDARADCRKTRIVGRQGERAYPPPPLEDIDQHCFAPAELLPLDFDASIGRRCPSHDASWHDREPYLTGSDDGAVPTQNLHFDAPFTACNDQRDPGESVRRPDGARWNPDACQRTHAHHDFLVAYPNREPTT